MRIKGKKHWTQTVRGKKLIAARERAKKVVHCPFCDAAPPSEVVWLRTHLEQSHSGRSVNHA